MTYTQQLARIAELYNLTEEQTKALDYQIHMAVLANPVQTIYDLAQHIIDESRKQLREREQQS
jgi:tRNA A37 N6-isopentenylltransferase MiaA